MTDIRDIRLTRKGKIVFGFLGALLFIPVGLYGVKLTQKSPEAVSFLERVTSEEAEQTAMDLLTEVSKFMDLPNEVPSIATVTEVEKLRNQTFYAKALNGDKVLIFSDAHKAVLYRPTEKKVIEVADVVFPEEEKQKQVAQQQVAGASVEAELVDASPSAEEGVNATLPARQVSPRPQF